MIGSLGSFTKPEAWVELAVCSTTDAEAFFPNPGGSTRDAKRICVGCPVQAECLRYALAHNEPFGIWGGLSERERRRVRQGLPAKRTHCHKGHNLEVVGRISNGSCGECRRIWNAKIKREAS